MSNTRAEIVQRKSEFAEIRTDFSIDAAGTVRVDAWNDSDIHLLKERDLKMIAFMAREIAKTTHGRVELARIAELIGTGDPSGLPAQIVRGLKKLEN